MSTGRNKKNSTQKKTNTNKNKSTNRKKSIHKKEGSVIKLFGLILASIFLALSVIFTGNYLTDTDSSGVIDIVLESSINAIEGSVSKIDNLDIQWAQNGEELDEQGISSLEELAEYSGEAYVVLNNNVPLFTEEELVTESYETYSDLDSLGRVGVAEACIGQDLMPTEERGSISEVTPTGWVQASYDIVDAEWLYNRCHLIGWQLSGEDANEQNLITGTRYLNIEGMLSFENMVAEYVEETGNHVMYRVTPHFEGDNLLANGLQIEAYSVEDEGEGICFYVYCYNVQPGITILYETGENSME